MFNRIKSKFEWLRGVGLYNTLYINFKVFPFHVARKLPILVGKYADIQGVSKGSILFEEGVDIYKGIVKLGIAPYPMVSNKHLYTMLRLSANGKIFFGSGVRILSGCSVIVSYNGVLRIGNDFLMNQKSKIYCAKSVDIGSHCRIGWESQIYDSDFHFLYNTETCEIRNAVGVVAIGDNVWVGTRTTIAKNSEIPDYSIIGSNSLVCKKLPMSNWGGIWIGMPVVLRKEGFIRILNEEKQYELFQYFLRDDTQTEKIHLELSEKEIDKMLNK